MTFQLSPPKRPVVRKRMKILILLAVVLLTLIFIFLVPEYTILAFFSPIILAIIFIGLKRPLHAEKT